jgi:nucleoside-diphosphate-sugar epimerase
LDWISRVKYGKTALPGGGLGFANLVYIDDLVEGFILAALVPGISGEAFFLSGPQPIIWKEYLGLFSEILQKPPLPIVSVWRARLEAILTRQSSRFTRRLPRLSSYHIDLMSRKSIYDISKAKRLIGYNPQHSFERGMKKTTLWLRKMGYI